jgi:hypothetical protein
MFTLLLLSAFIYANAPADQYGAELEEHISYWLEHVDPGPKRRYPKAVEMIPLILEYCEKYNVDPLRIAVLASQENSWLQQGRGKAGEVGPLQIMPKWFKKRFDVQTLDGQIEAGIWWLSEGLRICKTGARAYHWYRFAKCPKSKPHAGALWRERLYKLAVKKYRRKRIR